METEHEPSHDGALFSLMFPANLRELSIARDRVTTWLRDVGLDDDIVLDLSVVFSELGANAVAATRGTSQVGVTARRDGATVVLEVANGAGPDGTTAHPWDWDEALSSGGRGLLIVQALVDQVDVARRADGVLAVSCRRTL